MISAPSHAVLLPAYCIWHHCILCMSVGTSRPTCCLMQTHKVCRPHPRPAGWPPAVCPHLLAVGARKLLPRCAPSATAAVGMSHAAAAAALSCCENQAHRVRSCAYRSPCPPGVVHAGPTSSPWLKQLTSNTLQQLPPQPPPPMQPQCRRVTVCFALPLLMCACPPPPPVYVTLQGDSCDSIQNKFKPQLPYGLAACNQGVS